MSLNIKTGLVPRSWPSLGDIDLIRKKRYQESQKEVRRTKRQEKNALLEKIALEAKNRFYVKKSHLSSEMESFLRGGWFKDWYEEVTCKNGDQFVDHLINCEEWLLMGLHRDVWAHRKVNEILIKHRWKTPSYRRYWAKHISDCSDSRKRRAIILRLATPLWADLIKVAAFYKLRDDMTAETGEAHHVDHIVPLQGVNVCGLNNEFNLRVITAEQNLRKSNSFKVQP